MRFGLILTNQHPPGETMVERFPHTIDQVRLARDLGFDLLVFGQHFLPNEFQMLQPAIAAARLAAEAGPMRIGMTIYLLPLLNPVAVAEEAASLRHHHRRAVHLRHRAGLPDEEDEAFGLEPASGSRGCGPTSPSSEALGGEPVDFDAPYCRLREATMALRPIQRPRPPIWVAANNDRRSSGRPSWATPGSSTPTPRWRPSSARWGCTATRWRAWASRSRPSCR